MIGRLRRLVRPNPPPRVIDPDAALGLDPGEPYATHPPTPPAGWRTAAPDFVIVGAPDSGGAGLARVLAAQARVHQVRADLRAWERFFEAWPTDEDLERYRAFFARPAGLLAGELAPDLMSLAWQPRMLAEAAPDARIIVLLRDPMDRYLATRARLERYRPRASGWHYGPRSFSHWAADRAFLAGRYPAQLGWLADAFPRDHIRVLQYERLMADPARVVHRVLDFLGLSGLNVPVDGTTFREPVPSPTPIEPERRALISSLYRSEMPQLRAVAPELDLDLWPSVTTPA